MNILKYMCFNYLHVTIIVVYDLSQFSEWLRRNGDRAFQFHPIVVLHDFTNVIENAELVLSCVYVSMKVRVGVCACVYVLNLKVTQNTYVALFLSI